MTFPQGFIWGAAAAAYQVEGAAFADGRGLSVWDMMCRKEGAIWEGHTGDFACDHYHRYVEDVAIMQSIGLKAYRLSVSWSRVLPNGVGAVNPKGLEFYDKLVDELLKANIQPFVTLFHWDFPYELYCRGGWLNPDSPEWFAEYTTVLVDRLSDRVSHWLTLNEPQCFVGLGHKDGVHAPGDQLGWREVLRVGHHALLAHGKAVQTIRARTKQPAQIGYAPVGVVMLPAKNDPALVDLARTAMFAVYDKGLWNNTWFNDPVFRKEYPADGLKLFEAELPNIGANDMDIIGQPVDFYGVNIYSGTPLHFNAEGKPEPVPHPEGYPQTGIRWWIHPSALYWGPKFLWERYQKPIYITENGLSNIDTIALDGQVHDPQRIDYTARHLMALRHAIHDGVDVRGYFHWSIMDNFEWAEGYKQRFGMVYVDYPTQKRILKDSAYWYRDLIAHNGANLPTGAYEYV